VCSTYDKDVFLVGGHGMCTQTWHGKKGNENNMQVSEKVGRFSAFGFSDSSQERYR
jgi:hypothetical protein